eukprot:SAG31_NODE_15300_length_762_cov_0.552036_1_plen_144_part_10
MVLGLQCLTEDVLGGNGKKALTVHGRHVALMASVFGTDRSLTGLDNGNDFTTVPPTTAQIDEETSTVLGFHLAPSSHSSGRSGGGGGPANRTAGGGKAGLVFVVLMGNDTWRGAATSLTLTVSASLATDATARGTAPPTCVLYT